MKDPIVAAVNGQTLTRTQAQRIARDMILRQGIPPQMVDTYLAQAGEEVEKQAIEQFISQTLMRAEAERRREPVSDAEIDASLAQLTASLPEGVTIEKALASQGGSMAELRNDVAASERLRKLYETETAGLPPVTDEQVAAFYKENAAHFTTEETADARHILIGCAEDATAEKRAAAKAKAEDVRKTLVAGADFGEAAKAHSTCPSRQDGGHLGAMPRGRVVPAFEQAIFSQVIGEIGPVVETQFGYHVIQVMGREPGRVATQEEVAEEIREHLAGEAKDQRFNSFLKGLRDKADITYGDPTGGIIIP